MKSSLLKKSALVLASGVLSAGAFAASPAAKLDVHVEAVVKQSVSVAFNGGGTSANYHMTFEDHQWNNDAALKVTATSNVPLEAKLTKELALNGDKTQGHLPGVSVKLAKSSGGAPVVLDAVSAKPIDNPMGAQEYDLLIGSTETAPMPGTYTGDTAITFDVQS